jgi:hypothetical protein
MARLLNLLPPFYSGMHQQPKELAILFCFWKIHVVGIQKVIFSSYSPNISYPGILNLWQFFLCYRRSICPESCRIFHWAVQNGPFSRNPERVPLRLILHSFWRTSIVEYQIVVLFHRLSVQGTCHIMYEHNCKIKFIYFNIDIQKEIIVFLTYLKMFQLHFW